MMNQEVKKKWLDALRSGEYTQTKDSLCDNRGFCCLGVLCDLHAKDTNGQWKPLDPAIDGERSYCGNHDLLPKEVVSWAGLTETELDTPFGNRDYYNVDVTYTDEEGDEHATSLSDLNDNGWSFNMIADLIEKDL
jgi:hypothetical protein